MFWYIMIHIHVLVYEFTYDVLRVDHLYVIVIWRYIIIWKRLLLLHIHIIIVFFELCYGDEVPTTAYRYTTYIRYRDRLQSIPPVSPSKIICISWWGRQWHPSSILGGSRHPVPFSTKVWSPHSKTPRTRTRHDTHILPSTLSATPLSTKYSKPRRFTRFRTTEKLKTVTMEREVHYLFVLRARTP